MLTPPDIWWSLICRVRRGAGLWLRAERLAESRVSYGLSGCGIAYSPFMVSTASIRADTPNRRYTEHGIQTSLEPVAEAAHIQTLYDAIQALPEGVTGEIVDGQLHTQPRPAGPHAVAGSHLGGELFGPYDRGRGGPGGWWIIIDPEIHFVLNTEILVPDLAGWRRERMPSPPEDQRFQVVPD